MFRAVEAVYRINKALLAVRFVVYSLEAKKAIQQLTLLRYRN